MSQTAMNKTALSKADVLTEHIEIPVPDGTVMGAYLARPAALTSPGAGVVVAPDFYHRLSPGAELAHDQAGWDRGFGLLAGLDRRSALMDGAQPFSYLKNFGCERVGVVGLSLGGHLGCLAATEVPYAAVVAAYPGWPAGTEIGLSRPEPTLARTAGIHGWVLVVCGDADHAISGAERDAIGAALAAAGVTHEVVTYPARRTGSCATGGTATSRRRPRTRGPGSTRCWMPSLAPLAWEADRGP
jgi:carboxymethylenebutenolidase